jgi:hypothetical protein
MDPRAAQVRPSLLMSARILALPLTQALPLQGPPHFMPQAYIPPRYCSSFFWARMRPLSTTLLTVCMQEVLSSNSAAEQGPSSASAASFSFDASSSS